MCGIVGVLHRQPGPPVRAQVITEMCSAIRHRGPDDEGTLVDGAVGLGMRRLSIIDLAGGTQPVFNEDRSIAIVFNGEIYNYRELRNQLDASGHQFRTHSDTETIVHLYEELGRGCVNRLRGMFAFAIWDTRTRTLLLARDRFGIKPLYIVDAPWGLAFASELKALIAVGLTSRRLDWQALDTYFELGYIPAPFSPFLDVRKLEPGHTLEWNQDGKVACHRYWDLPRATSARPPNLAKRVREWIDDSVSAHLVSDVPVAALLSGGLDSSAVVSSMASDGQIPHAFTALYHGSGADEADETGLARQLADRYGAELTIIDVHPNIETIFEPIVRALDEPHADESVIPTWVISEAVAGSYKVALSGTGGDELFAGYRRHIGLLVGNQYAKLPSGIKRIAELVANRLPEPRGSSLGVNRLKRFLRTHYGAPADKYLQYLSRLPGDLRSQLYHPDIELEAAGSPATRHFRSLYERGGSPEGLSAALYLDYKTYLPDDILALSDRIAMAHSLEVRVPFVDHELVEKVFPLPDRAKIGFWKSKLLLRQALRPRLPNDHFRAPKRGFVGPSAAWLRTELRQLVTDELSSERLGRLGFFRPAATQSLLDDHFSRRHNRAGILWALLCFSTWHRIFVEQPKATQYRPSHS